MSLLSDLEEIKRAEKRKTKGLIKIKRNFYSEIMEEIENLKKREKELYENRNFKEALKLEGDITKIEKSFEELINLRIKKIFLSTIWEKKEMKDLTPEEIILYNDLKNAIDLFIGRIYGHEEPILKKEKNKEEKKTEEEKEEVILVRVIAPHAMFALPNRDVSLRKEDVLHLPKKIYNILSKKGIVEEIKL